MVKNKTNNQGENNMSQQLADKFGISLGLLDATKGVLSESDAYQAKVKAHMAKKGVKSLNDMTADQKKKFFNELDSMHKAKNEEVESVEEAESHQAKTTMKHISKPTAGEKKAAKDIKPGIAGYRDRVAMLKSAEARGALKKEEVELTQEDLDFIASLNQIDEVDQAEVVEGQLRNFSPHSDLAGRGRLSGYNKTAAGKKRETDRETERLKDKMKFTKGQGGIAGPKGKLPEEFDLDEEQLDELSKDTVASYAGKAGRTLGGNIQALSKAKEIGKNSYPEKSADQVKTTLKKSIANRKAGLDRAEKRLSENEEFDLEDFTVEEIEEFMQTEDYDQLDELSKETLGSYVKKRSHDVATQGALTRKHAMDSEAKKKEHGGYTTKAVRDLDDKANKAFMKGWKHRQNIGKAVDKIVNKA